MAQEYPDWYIEQLRKLEGAQTSGPTPTPTPTQAPNTAAPSNYPPEYLEKLRQLEGQEQQKQPSAAEQTTPLPSDYIEKIRQIDDEHKKDKGFLEYVGEASKERGVAINKGRLRIINDLWDDKVPEPYQLPEMPKRGLNKKYIGTLLGEKLETDVIPGIAATAAGTSLGGTVGALGGPIGAAAGAAAGAMTANGAFSYLSTFADEYNNARNSGLDHEKAFAYAEKQGGIAGGFGIATGMLSRLGGRELLPYLFKQIPAQVAASEAENIAHNIMAKESGVDPERDPFEGWQEAATIPVATTLAGGVLTRNIGREHIRPPEKVVTPVQERLGLPGPEGGEGTRAPMAIPSPTPDGSLEPTPRVRPNTQTGTLEPITTDINVKETPINEANIASLGASEQQMNANQVPPNIVHIGNVIRGGAGLPPPSPPAGGAPPGLPPPTGAPPGIPPGAPPPGGGGGAGVPTQLDLAELHQRITGIREKPLNDFQTMVRNTTDMARDVYNNLQNSGTLLFDRFRPALNIGISIGAQRESQAVGYRMARFADHTHGQVDAAYRFGTPYWDPSQQIMRVNTDAPGLLEIIEPRFASQDAAEFELYMYAKRVKEQGLHEDFPGDVSHLLHLLRLNPQLHQQVRTWLQQNNIPIGTGGREQNLTIHEVNRIVDHFENNNPEFVQSWGQWNEYNNAVNDFMEDTGLRDPSERDLYDLGDWVSFERNLGIFDENHYRGPSKRLTRQQVARHLLTGKGKMYQVLDRQNQEFTRVFDRQTAVNVARDIGGRIQEVGIPVRNLYENMLAGTAMKIAKGVKNAAANQIMREAQFVGLATQIPEHVALNRYRDEPIPNVVRTTQNGRPAYFYVDDPDLFNMMEPLLSVPTMPGPAQQVLYYAKQLFSWSTMSVPRTAINVVLKDMMMMGLSGKDIFPTMGDAIASYTQNLPTGLAHEFGHHDPRLIQIAAAGAQVSFTRNRPVDVADRLYLEHYRPGEISAMIVRGSREAGRIIGRISRAYETANRLMRYDAAIANGLNEAEAAFEYMDYLDYQLKGSSPWVNEFIRISPFLQSYSQSLYKLGRDLGHATPPPGGLPPGLPPPAGAAGAGRGPHRRPHGFQRVGRSVFNKTIRACKWYAAFSIINAIINVGYDEEDEEGGEGDFFKHSSQKRDNYTIIDLKRWFGKKTADNMGVRYIYIPKPWQLGQLFGTLPEQAVYLASQREGFADQINFLGRTFKNSFGIDILSNPIFKTIYESASGMDWYTGRPIVPQAKQNLEPFMQSRPTTSETAIKFGEQFNVSPAKAEKFANNLLGGFMMGPLMIADMFQRDYDEPNKTWYEKDILKNYFGGETPANSDFVNQTWELYKDAERAYLTINSLSKEDMDKKLQNYETRHDVQIRESNYKELKKVTETFKDIDKDIEDIKRSKFIDKAEKRTMIKNLQRQKNIEAYQAVKSVKAEQKRGKK